MAIKSVNKSHVDFYHSISTRKGIPVTSVAESNVVTMRLVNMAQKSHGLSSARGFCVSLVFWLFLLLVDLGTPSDKGWWVFIWTVRSAVISTKIATVIPPLGDYTSFLTSDSLMLKRFPVWSICSDVCSSNVVTSWRLFYTTWLFHNWIACHTSCVVVYHRVHAHLLGLCILGVMYYPRSPTRRFVHCEVVGASKLLCSSSCAFGS